MIFIAFVNNPVFPSRNNGNLFYNSDEMTNGFGNGGLFATLDNSPALESGDFLIR